MSQGSQPNPQPDHQPVASRGVLFQHPIIVQMVLWSTLLLTIGMVGIIWYRYHGVDWPESVLEIQGDETLAGAQVHIHPADGKSSDMDFVLDASNHYLASANVRPGVSYQVVVMHDQILVAQNSVTVESGYHVRWPLVPDTSTTRAATPGDQSSP